MKSPCICSFICSCNIFFSHLCTSHSARHWDFMGTLDVVLVSKMCGVQWGGPEYCGAQGRSLSNPASGTGKAPQRGGCLI